MPLWQRGVFVRREHYFAAHARPRQPDSPPKNLALYESQYRFASTNGGVASGGGSSCPLKTTPPRREEHFGIWEVGSKRLSSGCNGVHVLCLNPLIWRLLTSGLPTPVFRSTGATTIVGPGEAGAAGLGERARGSEPGANEVR